MELGQPGEEPHTRFVAVAIQLDPEVKTARSLPAASTVVSDSSYRIEWGAEHGDAEARKIWEDKSPTRFMSYKLYDLPRNAWGISTELYKTPLL